MLLHHGYADGTGASLMMQRCFKPKPFAFSLKYTPSIAPRLPTKLQLLVRALADLPGTFITSIPVVLRGVINTRKLVKRRIAEGKELAPNLFKDKRDSPVNDMVSACRSFVFETFELARIKRISKSFQVTINDLFVACAAAMYRRFLIDKGYDPDSGPLLTAIPVSQRSPSATDDGLGNRMSSDVLAMPVHITDPLARLAAAHHAGNMMKEHYRESQGADMSSVLELLPAFAIRAINRSIARTRGKSGMGGNAMLSNVPGPREILYLGDMRMDNWISSGQVTHGMAINVTAWSYADNFNLCILADKKVLPDGWYLINHFAAALDEYDQLARQKQNASAMAGPDN
jgi:WS/DGAT/MGAT family acyltransferase